MVFQTFDFWYSNSICLSKSLQKIICHFMSAVKRYRNLKEDVKSLLDVRLPGLIWFSFFFFFSLSFCCTFWEDFLFYLPTIYLLLNFSCLQFLIPRNQVLSCHILHKWMIPVFSNPAFSVFSRFCPLFDRLRQITYHFKDIFSLKGQSGLGIMNMSRRQKIGIPVFPELISKFMSWLFLRNLWDQHLGTVW